MSQHPAEFEKEALLSNLEIRYVYPIIFYRKKSTFTNIFNKNRYCISIIGM